MTNTEFRTVNDAEPAMISGGDGPISGMIELYKDEKTKKLLRQFKVRVIQSTGQAVNDVVNSVWEKIGNRF